LRGVSASLRPHSGPFGRLRREIDMPTVLGILGWMVEAGRWTARSGPDRVRPQPWRTKGRPSASSRPSV